MNTPQHRPRHPFPLPQIPSDTKGTETADRHDQALEGGGPGGLLKEFMETQAANLRQAWEAVDLKRPKPWIKTFYSLFDGVGELHYPQRAERLSAYGWNPKNLESACTTGHTRQHPSAPTQPNDPWPEDAAEAHAALWQEVTLYHSAAGARAARERTRASERLVEAGWNQPQIGSLLGISKQRVHTVLSAPTPAKRNTDDERDGQLTGEALADLLGEARTPAQGAERSSQRDQAGGEGNDL